MTVESTTTRAAFTGNGISRAFPLPFPLLSASHLEVYVTPKKMADSMNVPPLSGGYSVQDIDSDEPYVVYPEDVEAPPLQAGWQLTAVRRLPLVQQTNLENGGNLHAETLEIQFDMLVMQLQQLAYDIQRSVKIPPYSASESADVTEVLQKMEKLCERAEYAAQRVELQADMNMLVDNLGNLAATWVAEKDIMAGELMELPIHYVPGGNVLLLSVDGVLCYPGNAPDAGWESETSSHNQPEQSEQSEQLGQPEQELLETTLSGTQDSPESAPGEEAVEDGQTARVEQAKSLAEPGPDSPYQYEEVSGAEPFSRIVRILFPLVKGTVCHARVTASNIVLSEAP